MLNLKKLTVILLITISFYGSEIRAADKVLSSPDGRIRIEIDFKEKVYYTVFYNDQLIVYPSPLSLTVNEGQVLGSRPVLLSSNLKQVNTDIPVLYGRRKMIKDHYNELNLSFSGNYGIIFRVYDDGLAWRFYTQMKSPLKVVDEEASFYFAGNHRALLPVAGNFQTSFEQIRQWMPLLDMNESNFATLPALIKVNNLNLLITDADVRDYPGMYLYRPGSNNRPWLKGLFPEYPSKTEQGGWGLFNIQVKERADYIAMTAGKREFPWRLIVMTERDADLAENDMVYKLASPAEIPTDWIKPGKVSWEWWNDWNLEGVDFITGVNNETYRYYIDFAAANGLEYVIMDEGWSDQFDLLLPVPGLDVPALAAYAKEKNVRLILWCVWHTLDRQMAVAMDQFEKWGIAGVKVDFIDRDDQESNNFMERCAREAAKRKLLVDYHGCPKPTGLSRTFPNIINYEGVIGNEYNKGNWNGNFPTPEHNVTIPFTRMMAGPMDYTPGAMRNSTQTSFGFSNSTPMSRGTRCHQLGMYIVYDSPLQMLCDAPTEYLKYPDILSFLSKVPVTWDDTKILDGVIGEYIITLRKKDDSWYVGGMTNWTARDYAIDLSFLPTGRFVAEIFKDGVNAGKLGNDYRYEKIQVQKGEKLKIHMAPGGGFAVVLRPVN